MKTFHVFAGGVDASRSRIESVPANLNTNHCHDKYEILYVIEGSGRCLIEGVEYPIKPRTIFVFPPLVYHVAYLEKDTAYDRAVVSFDPSSVSESVLDILQSFGIGQSNLSPVAFYRADAISDQIAALFERFEIAESFSENEKSKFLGLLVSELILFVSMANREAGGYDDSDLGARVIRYLNEFMDKDIKLDWLARRFFVSKYHLCRAFKKYNGISVHGYINQKRIMYAKQLIESGETASRAAYRVGYGDYSAFYRAYVKVLGKAPTANEADSPERSGYGE